MAKQKMVECPLCEEKINSLIEEEQVWARYKVKLASGYVDYIGKGEIVETADPNGDEQNFYCPKCNGQLPINDQDGAEAFLLGKKLDEQDDDDA